MPLPSHEEQKDTYSSDEVRHLVAREVMKHRLDQFETEQLQVKEEIRKIGAEISTSNKMLTHQVEKLHEVTAKGAKDLRSEIERDFASKAELIKLEGKVDGLALKISFGTGAIVLAIQVLMKFVG
jgi:uncharacterized protein YPO0396